MTYYIQPMMFGQKIKSTILLWSWDWRHLGYCRASTPAAALRQPDVFTYSLSPHTVCTVTL